MVDSRRLSEFVNDSRLLMRIKVENYLLVHLGLRPCSQMTLLAELPNSEAMGSAIEKMVSPKMNLLKGEVDPRRRVAIIMALKNEMKKAYDKVVTGSEEYRSHLSWAKVFGLRKKMVEVRPTIRELYLFRDRGTGRRLGKLMKERLRLRARAYKRVSSETEKIHLAYPEELSGPWLREMGRTLGYPECCVEAYASEREKGVNVETRAARQIEEFERRGGVDPFAYFVGYFYPCAPDCGEASSIGREALRLLSELGHSLGELYATSVAGNLDRVRHQPEATARHRAHAEGYVREHR